MRTREGVVRDRPAGRPQNGEIRRDSFGLRMYGGPDGYSDAEYLVITGRARPRVDPVSS